MSEISFLAKQIGNRCRHYNGVQSDMCRAGMYYQAVRTQEKRYPCFKDQGCTNRCPAASFPTPEEVEQQAKAREQRVIDYIIEVSLGTTCPICHQPIQSKVQIGRSVYARPCQHRLYQGKLEKKQSEKERSDT